MATKNNQKIRDMVELLALTGKEMLPLAREGKNYKVTTKTLSEYIGSTGGGGSLPTDVAAQIKQNTENIEIIQNNITSLSNQLDNNKEEIDDLGQLVNVQKTDIQNNSNRLDSIEDNILDISGDIEGLKSLATTTSSGLMSAQDKMDLNTLMVFYEGTDTDSTINSWKELEKFLEDFDTTKDLADLLTSKADKSTVVAINSRVTDLETSDFVDIDSLRSALGGYVNEIAASGTGNGIASVSKDGSKLTFNKATFLTSHQSLDGYINNVSDENNGGNVVTSYRKSGKNLVLQKGLSVYSKAEVDKLIGDISIPDLDGYVTTETLTSSLSNLANTYLSFRDGGTVSGATTFSGGLSVQNSLTLLGVNVAAGSSGLTFDGKIPMYSGDAYTKSEADKEFHPLTTVDTAPTINSSNLVTSGGVAKAVADLAESADGLYQRKGSYLTASSSLSSDKLDKNTITIVSTPVALGESITKNQLIANLGLKGLAFKDNIDLSGYLPLDGGKMSGPIEYDDYTSLGAHSNGNFYLGNPTRPLVIRSNGTHTINGNTLIHSGNIANYAIAKNSEAVLSRLTVETGSDAKIILNNTDTESKYQYISFRQNGTEYGALGTFYDDNLIWNQNYILHSKNYSDYALPLSGGKLTGALTIADANGSSLNITKTDNSWAYINIQSSSQQWHVGLPGIAYTGLLDTSRDFEVRSLEDTTNYIYTGIAVRRNTSSYGKLVVVSNGGECSIGFRNTPNISTLPQWVLGMENTNQFGVWSTVAGRYTIYTTPTTVVSTLPMIFEIPTNVSNNYNEGARFNLGGSSNWAGFTIGGAAGSTSGSGNGVYSFLVNSATLQLRHNNSIFLEVNTNRDVIVRPRFFAVMSGNDECGIRFGAANDEVDFVGRYSNYMSLYNATNPSYEFKIPDSGEPTIGGKVVYTKGNLSPVTIDTTQTITSLKTFSVASYPQIVLNSTSGSEVNMRLDMSGSAKGYVGYINAHGTFLYNVKAAKYLAINDSGVPHLSGNTIWHAGNSNLSTINWNANVLSCKKIVVNHTTTDMTLSLVHTSDSYLWNYINQVSNNYIWHLGVNSLTEGSDKLENGSYEIRAEGKNHNGIFIRYATSSFGKLVVATQSSSGVEASIGYLNTRHSSNYPVWTVGAGIGGDRAFGWYYYNVGCKMYLTQGGDLSVSGSLGVAGNVGIGTTDPRAKLHVVGGAKITGGLTVGSSTDYIAYDGSSLTGYKSSSSAWSIDPSGSGSFASLTVGGNAVLTQGALTSINSTLNNKANTADVIPWSATHNYASTVNPNLPTSPVSDRWYLVVKAAGNGNQLMVNIPWVNTTYDLSSYLPKAGGKISGSLTFSSTSGSHIIGNSNSEIIFQPSNDTGSANIPLRIAKTGSSTFTMYCDESEVYDLGTSSYRWNILYCRSASQSSDATLKNILGNVELTTAQIANAPAVHFTWKNGGAKDVGTIAQYWKNVLPEVVSGEEGSYGMNYAVLGVVSSIILARNIETHEQRIARLEKEISDLQKELNALVNNE